MLTREENERLTRVGPGTPCGELMRRYWWPIAATSQLPGQGTRPITILGEQLVLYRDRAGTLGLVAQRCPHRRAGMVFGIPEQEGLRCAYHGWLFNAEGRCLEQPYETTENPDSTFKDRVGITAYPVEELGGLIFAYLGPQPAPLLPRWDLFVLDGVPKDVGIANIPCNWLQSVENGLDPYHTEYLHGHFFNYVFEQLGQPEWQTRVRRHTKIGFSEFEYGIVKRRVTEGATEAHEMWAVGHPMVFPSLMKSGSRAHPTYQIRVPTDDTHTAYYYYTCYMPRPGTQIPPTDTVAWYEVPGYTLDEQGAPIWSMLDNDSGQDISMWYTQGEVTDRTEEHLGLSDKGVILYRQQLDENIARVERGEDPMNVFRDPINNVCLELDVEEDKTMQGPYRPAAGPRRGNASKYSPVLSAFEAAYLKSQEVAGATVE